jgi:hypothetical protein
VIRPEPTQEEIPRNLVDKTSDPESVAEALIAGETFLVSDLFSTGLNILAALRRTLDGGRPRDSHKDERAFRAAFKQASARLLVPIKDNRIDLQNAPEIGWLKELYSDISKFVLTFPQVQGLNSSWQWYTKGTQMPVLHRRLHPFYGTYFPSRFEHLELFADWLKKYRGNQNLAIDVGTGCGVLAFQLSQAHWPQVLATDINPNALESVRRELKRKPVKGEIKTEEADLLGEGEELADLIVFNPPWLPGKMHNALDLAMYYPPDLFDRFFRVASKRLAPQGRVVVVFSNLLQIEGSASEHPVRKELEKGGRFVLAQRLEGKVSPSSKKTKRRKRAPSKELVELWELQRTSASSD